MLLLDTFSNLTSMRTSGVAGLICVLVLHVTGSTPKIRVFLHAWSTASSSTNRARYRAQIGWPGGCTVANFGQHLNISIIIARKNPRRKQARYSCIAAIQQLCRKGGKVSYIATIEEDNHQATRYLLLYCFRRVGEAIPPLCVCVCYHTRTTTQTNK